jgi:6-pyruvoyltetrahydropterin/6-carboxytetrahydropterin synthase
VRTVLSVRHNFETGHRLPHLGGKCGSLHGHSWWAEVEVSAELDEESAILVEYGQLKALIREWIDTHLDHGLMLGTEDPLRELLAEHGKVYELAPWPTVERVAGHLAEVCQELVDSAQLGVQVSRVRVTETGVNAAEVRP